MDEEGFFFLVGRKDDLLKVGGHRLNPQEIEDTLMESGLFVEAVVLGLPDTLLGNKLVILAVLTKEDCTENEIFTFFTSNCRNSRSPLKPGSPVRFPKNRAGKSTAKHVSPCSSSQLSLSSEIYLVVTQ